MRVISILCRLAGVISALLFTGAAFVVCYEVFMRYIGLPTRWGQDLAIYFMIAGAFLAQGAVMHEDGHVRVDVFIQLFPKWLRVLSVRITLLVGLVYAVAMTWEGFGQAAFSYEIGRMSTSLFRIPTWIPEATIPIGFGLLVLAIIYQVIRPDVAGPDREFTSVNEL